MNVDFDLTEDQRMLAESAQAVLRGEYDLMRRRRQLALGAASMDRALWRQWGELGWLALTIPESLGGIGQDLVSAMVLVERLGENLVLSPYLESAIQSGRLLELLGSDAQKGELLPRLASGETMLVFVHDGREIPSDEADAPPPTIRARPGGTGGYLLRGEQTGVPYAAVADRWIVIAATEDRPDDPTAFLVDPASRGVAIRPFQDIDGTPMADIALDDTPLPASARLGVEGLAAPAVDQAQSEMLGAVCIEAVAVMTKLHGLTLDYVKTRKQFGVAIGSFQANQHRLVEMYMKLELARPLAWLAAGIARTPKADRRFLQAAAKAQVAESARFVAEQAIQLHGGIGMTDEAEASHAFRRLAALERRLGTRQDHLATIARSASRGEATLYA